METLLFLFEMAILVACCIALLIVLLGQIIHSACVVDFAPLEAILRYEKQNEKELSKLKKFWLVLRYNFSYVLFLKTVVNLLYDRFMLGLSDDEVVPDKVSEDPSKVFWLVILNYITGAFIWGYPIFLLMMFHKMLKYKAEQRMTED